jgi:very-short-patch-repair endonuclease
MPDESAAWHIGKARHLRRALSSPEARLWTRLRERAPGKPVFRRQHPIGPYVLEFYCARARLAIESMEQVTNSEIDRSAMNDVRLG